MKKQYSVYILTNHPRHTVLYIGVTGDMIKRIWQHKKKLVKGFTQRYNVAKLVYVESYNDVHSAIKREKQLKGWKREKKELLISRVNPNWVDLYTEISGTG